MLKKLIAVIFAVSLLVSCIGTQEDLDKYKITEDELTVLAVKAASREIGCEIALAKNAELTRAVQNLIDLVATGEFTEDALAQASEQINKYIDLRPTLVASVMDLLDLLAKKASAGKIVLAEGEEVQIVGTLELAPQLTEAAQKGFAQGSVMCANME